MNVLYLTRFVCVSLNIMLWLCALFECVKPQRSQIPISSGNSSTTVSPPPNQCGEAFFSSVIGFVFLCLIQFSIELYMVYIGGPNPDELVDSSREVAEEVAEEVAIEL